MFETVFGRQEPVDHDAELVEVLSAEFARVINLTPEVEQTPLVPQIRHITGLTRHFPTLVETVYREVGPQQTETTYKRCIKALLEDAGVEVDIAADIHLLYRNRVIDTRSADMVLNLQAGEKAIVQVKSAPSLTQNHLAELKQYQDAYNVNRGYLVNFPSTSSSTGPRKDKNSFDVTVVLGDDTGLNLCSKYSRDRCVQLVQVERGAASLADEEESSDYSETSEEQQEPIYGVTRDGRPCRVCIREGRFCALHRNQIRKQQG